MSGLSAVLAPLRVPFQALVVAIAGVGVAWLLLNGYWYLAVLAIGIAIIVGLALDAHGRDCLPGTPVRAVRCMEWWLLVPIAIAVFATAVGIVVTVELTLPKGTPTETEKLIGSVGTGLLAFLSAAFITWAGDEKDSKLADHIQIAMEARYVRPGAETRGVVVFDPGSPGDLWAHAGAYGGIEGWGRKARFARAEGIAKALG